MSNKQELNSCEKYINGYCTWGAPEKGCAEKQFCRRFEGGHIDESKELEQLRIHYESEKRRADDRSEEVAQLNMACEQIKAHNTQLADALVFVRDNLKHNENKGIGLSALVKLNKALSTPISQQYIKEMRARDAVVEAMVRIRDSRLESTPHLDKFDITDIAHVALDNLKEIEKGE